MRAETAPRIAYVVKRYPRFSETFIVNEILAHEAAGTEIEVFALYPPNDTHFQDLISRVRAPVTYLTADGLRGVDLWNAIDAVGAELPWLWRMFYRARGCDARSVYQGVLLAREIRRRGIDHVHAHFATSAAEVARLAAGWARVPFTVTAHAKDIFHDSVTTARLKQVLDGAAQVVTVSDFNVAHLTRAVGLDPVRITRIYNGLDLNRFDYCAPVDRPARIVSVGRMVPKKGLTDLVRACAILRARGVAFECVLVGGGSDELAIRTLIAKESLQSRVHLTGPLPQQQMMRVVRGAAVFAAPSILADDGDRDGLPTALVEAMALGTPVVSTNVVGIPELVCDDDTGLLVPQRTPDRLADALQRLLESPHLQVRLSHNARERIERDFDIHKTSGAMRALFATPRAQTLVKVS